MQRRLGAYCVKMNKALYSAMSEMDARKERERLQRLAGLLDDAYTLPGGYRIGLDGLMGIVPVVGDIAGAVLALYIVWRARRLKVPLRLQGRMLGNIVLELVVGLVPVVGDIFDIAFKANRRNLQLIEGHFVQQEALAARAGVAWRPGRWALLLVLLAVLMLLFL